MVAVTRLDRAMPVIENQVVEILCCLLAPGRDARKALDQVTVLVDHVRRLALDDDLVRELLVEDDASRDARAVAFNLICRTGRFARPVDCSRHLMRLDGFDTPKGSDGEPLPLSEEELSALMRDPRYWRDREPAVVRRVTEALRRFHTSEQAVLGCPDNQLPDGPTCPKCGGPRAPSGVDGGSWVHYPRKGMTP